MKSRCRLLILTVLALLVLSSLAMSQNTPGLLSYQGRLTDTTGNPLNLTDQVMTFRIWNNQTLTDPTFLKWEETQTVQVVNGLFNVLLGSINPLTDTVFSSSESFLGISIGNDPEGTPRTRLVSVGYSTRVETVEGAKGGVISGTITLNAGGAKSASPTFFPEFNILNVNNQVAYSANEARVFTPCVLFEGDSSLQCSAATNSGAAQSEDGSGLTSIGSGYTTLLQQTINCPGEGYVLVLGSCQANINHHEHSTSNVEFGVSDQSGQLCWDQHKDWTLPDDMESGNYSVVISAQKIFTVSAGAKTFWFLGHKTCGGPASATDKTLSLVFIPKAYGTVQSLTVSDSPEPTRELSDPIITTVSADQGVVSGVKALPSQPESDIAGKVAAQEREIVALKQQLNDMKLMIQNSTKKQK